MASSSSESIPLNKMTPTPRTSDSIDEEERDTLLIHRLPNQRSPNRTLGAILQIITFTAVGLLIALASGVFAYSLRGRIKSDHDFTHAPLPGLRDPLLLKYFGGMGPYIGGEYIKPPNECKVGQVHMISRHGERYPTTKMGLTISQFASNISRLSNSFHGDLSFLNNWTLSTSNWLSSPEDQLDQETLTGPAAGSLRMFTLGSEFRSRYDLWNFGDHNQVKVWSSDSHRVIQSAKYFASGYFGLDTNVSVQVIPETEGQWGNSLTTTDSCIAFKTGRYNVSYGFSLAETTYQRTFLPKITERLNKMSRTYEFTGYSVMKFTYLDDDVLTMLLICPFQINALGYSPFCDIFTVNEWKDFNYARDLGTYYASGPGNPYGTVMGQPWVEAVIDLMKQNSTNHNLYFSFSHDTDMVPMIPALGIFPAPNDDPLPWNKYDENRVFWTTSIVPMGGHIVIERLQCGEEVKVRVVVNERVQAVPGCDTPTEDGICALEEFEKVVKSRWKQGFCETCAPNRLECVDKISFFEA